MHFLLGGIGGIASQVSEVLYAGDVDVAGGNLYPVFVSEYKCVVVSLCRVGSDDSHLQVGDVGDGNGNIFGDNGWDWSKHILHISFDERGHQKNQTVYFVYGSTGEGEAPEKFYPTTEMFIGEGGSFTHPRAVLENRDGVKSGYHTEGKEAVGGIRV